MSTKASIKIKTRKSLKEEYAPPDWERLQAGQCSEEELEQLNENPYDPVDIIAVQGLASTYEWTWKKETAKGDVMWLRDLLPHDIPNARILTFEYGSKWYKDPDHVSLRDCGKKLLKRIVQDRSHTGGGACQTMNRRPIVFVGHSYGGLVIKQALVLASNLKPHEKHYLDYRSILTSITGIVYLGTPHGGSQFASFGVMQTRFRSWTGRAVNTEILKPLELNSKKTDLFELQEDFERMIEMACVSGLKVVHFFETKSIEIGIGFMGFRAGVVVEKESACMGARGDCAFTLEANHMEMNKFGSRDDENYLQVLGPLKEIVAKSAGIVKERWAGSDLHFDYDSPRSNAELKDLQNWLIPTDKFIHRLQRLQAVVASSPGTCVWATEHEDIARWMNPSENLSARYRTLWIHGKPGSGKSVISAYIRGVLEERTPVKGLAKLGRYVCPGITAAETCAEPPVDVPGLAYVSLENQQDVVSALGNIIHQLIRQRKRDTEVLRAALKFMASTEVLSQFSALKLLKKVVARLPTTFIIIDGIDECDSAEELLNLLHTLPADRSNLRLLILSRADPSIRKLVTERFCEPSNQVDIATCNAGDITLFIQTQIASLIVRRPQLAGIQDVLVERMNSYARGMFQWVKLKLHGLEVHGDNPQNALDLLGAFPQSLNEVYKKSFDRYYDEEYPAFKRNRASLALKWIVCAARPLHPREVRIALELDYFWSQDAVVSQYSSAEIFAHVCNEIANITDQEIEQELSELLDPFIEIQQTVQEGGQVWKAVHICHLSVSQLLLGNDPAFQKSGYTDFAFTDASVNAFAAMTCLRMIASSESFYNFITTAYKTTTARIEDTEYNPQTSLLLYAYSNWALHLSACDLPFDNNVDLFTLATHSLQSSLNASVDVVGGLTQLFEKINVQNLGDMYLMVAFRDAQNALEPIAQNLEVSLPSVPALSERLRKINNTVRARQIRKASSNFRRRTTGFDADGKIKGKGTKVGRLSSKNAGVLDSVLAAEAFELTKVYKEMYKPLRHTLSTLQRTSRDLRRLSFALGVDPVRNWLDENVGVGGTAPIPVLAHTSYLADVFSLLPILPRVRSELLRFDDQFKADGSHPLYGPMTSVALVLDRGRTVALPQGFYSEHVEPHLLLEKREWESIRLGLYLFEQSTNQQNHDALRMLLYTVLKFPVFESWDQTGTYLPSVIFEQLRPRLLRRRARGIWAKLQEAPRFVLPTVAKIIMLICPPVETLFFSMMREVMVRMHFTGIILRGFVSEWRYSIVGTGLYLLRWKFLPNFFRYNLRKHPITDFLSVLKDPLVPVPIGAYAGFWKTFWVVLFRGLIFTAYFQTKALTEQLKESPEQAPAIDLPVAIKRPLRTGEKFLDLIYFEFGVAGALEAVIELFGVAAVLARPNTWTWGTVSGSVQSVLVTIMIKELGLLQTAVIITRYGITLWTWSRLQRSVFLRRMFSTYALPVLKTAGTFLASHALFSPLVTTTTKALSLWQRYAPTPSTAVKLIAFTTAAYYTTLLYVLLDPLRLRRSERARKKARKSVLRVRKGREDWNDRLRWVGLRPVLSPFEIGMQLYRNMMANLQSSGVNMDAAVGALGGNMVPVVEV